MFYIFYFIFFFYKQLNIIGIILNKIIDIFFPLSLFLCMQRIQLTHPHSAFMQCVMKNIKNSLQNEIVDLAEKIFLIQYHSIMIKPEAAYVSGSDQVEIKLYAELALDGANTFLLVKNEWLDNNR